MERLLTKQMKKRALQVGGALCMILDVMISRFL